MVSLTRITQLKIFFLFLFLILIARLFYWQVLRAQNLLSLSNKQYLSSKIISPKRGEIFSQDEFPLVLNKDLYRLSLQRKDELKISFNKQNVESLARIISEESVKEATEAAIKKEIFEKEEERLADLLEKDGPYFILAKRLSEEQKQAVLNLKKEGLFLEPEPSRYYPEASMSAHLLGFLGKNKVGDNLGYFGLEGYYDTELKGKTGFLKREKDAFFEPIFTGLSLNVNSRDGRSLTLNLDMSVQYIVEDELKKAIKRYGAKAGSVIVMDPNNGAVLAMASLPTYEPAEYWTYDEKDFKNPIIADTYEPGSTFKVITMATAFDTGAVDDKTRCDICDGPYKLDKYTINTWDNKYRPNSSMSDIIVYSDNVGMVFISQKIDSKDFENYFDAFGFGQKTGIDLQEEVPAFLREKWSYVDRATASFGQGIAVTPIQMIRAVAAIANGGMLVKPRVVYSLKDGSKKINTQKKDNIRIIKKSVAKKITDMMVQAVEKGESKWIKPTGIKVAGKTGTAQIPIAGHYDEEKTIASFVGFAPADNPRYVILTIVQEPTSSPWGSETAAPLFFNILKRVFLHTGAQIK